MALTLRANLNHLQRSLCRSFSSLDALITSSDEDETQTHNITLSPSDSTLSQILHSVIRNHYRRNPISSGSSNLPNLSLDFSQISPPGSLSTPLVAQVIRSSASVRHGVPFPQILSFFNWALSQAEDLGPEAYHHLVDAAGKVRDFDAAWHAIHLMKQKGLQTPLHTFLALIQRYVRAGLDSEALLVFNRMDEFGCEPNLEAFTVVISILCKKRRAREAQAFFDANKERFKPDVVAYTSLANGWGRAGEIAEAERVFAEMKTLGIQPNVYTYTVLLDALCRSGHMTRAHDVFADMIKAGCQPNAATFNNLMRVHVKAGRTEKVLQVYNQMKRLSCTPDVITYNFLIDSHCRCDNRDEAIKLINIMEKKGCKPNAWSFNPIFRCIAKARDVNGAHRLFSKMQELKCNPNTATYNILMQMFAESKSTDMVIKLKKEMEANEVEANVNTFQILITMYHAMGHWNYAYQYLREMVEEKCLKPSNSVYKMVLELLRKAGQLKKHEELVEKMIRRGFVVRSV